MIIDHSPFAIHHFIVGCLAFLAGSLPFSVWIGRGLLGRDIRHYGDANPGATNVLRAGGKFSAMLALLLDFLKGALPVGIAHYWLKVDGVPLIVIALMPVLGHAYSPFLGWRGGKAVAVSCGIWCGLTVWEGPTVGGLLLGVGVFWLGANGWAVLFAFVGVLLYFTVTPPAWNLLMARPPISVIWGVWLGNFIIVAWKHRTDLLAGRRTSTGS